MSHELTPVEHKFVKSRLNAGTESRAHEFILLDPRFQKPDAATKRAILEGLELTEGSWSQRSFDLIMTEPPASQRISISNVAAYVDDITLIEVKSTRDEHVKDKRLNRFFYGSTKNQYDLAEAAGDRLLYAFVVLTDTNAYGKPFFVLVPFADVQRMTRTKRIQYQVNFRSDMATSGAIQGPFPITAGSPETKPPLLPG